MFNPLFEFHNVNGLFKNQCRYESSGVTDGRNAGSGHLIDSLLVYHDVIVLVSEGRLGIGSSGEHDLVDVDDVTFSSNGRLNLIFNLLQLIQYAAQMWLRQLNVENHGLLTDSDGLVEPLQLASRYLDPLVPSVEDCGPFWETHSGLLIESVLAEQIAELVLSNLPVAFNVLLLGLRP